MASTVVGPYGTGYAAGRRPGTTGAAPLVADDACAPGRLIDCITPAARLTARRRRAGWFMNEFALHRRASGTRAAVMAFLLAEKGRGSNPWNPRNFWRCGL